MKVLIHGVEPGLKRVTVFHEQPHAGELVGYLRKDSAYGNEVWTLVDHLAGRDVLRGQRYRHAVYKTREYFSNLEYCNQDCGRLTTQSMCSNCRYRSGVIA